MKYLALISSIFVFSLGSCTNETDNENPSSTSKALSTGKTEAVNAHFLSVDKWDSLKAENDDYFILSYAGTDTEEKAIKMVDSLLVSFPNAGYLWIPDFASLSGKELYAIFLDHEKYDMFLMESLQKLKQEYKDIYMVRVNQNTQRWVAYSPIDIRIDAEKQRMILIYATPEDEEAYAEGGGEDWGWFVNDVSEYFSEHHPEILFENVYYSGLLPSEIEKIESEVNPEGFGYILMDGNQFDFVGHDLPDGVIFSACEFFGFESEVDNSY